MDTTREHQHPGYLALHAATDGTPRAVVEHHRPKPVMSWHDKDRVAYWQCHGCDPGDHAEDHADWPCTTTELIAEQYRIQLDPRHYIVDAPQLNPNRSTT